MALPLPTLNALWRTSPIDDREAIRSYAEAPATEINLSRLTVAMNLMAETSPAAVAKVKAWIDEIEDLESIWADKVASGTAHLGNAEEYEGPVPGTTPTRDQQLKRADVVEWDTNLLRVRYRSGSGAGTEGAVLDARVRELKHQVLVAVGFDGASAGARLIRS